MFRYVDNIEGLLSQIKGRRYIFWVAPRGAGKTTMAYLLFQKLRLKGEDPEIYGNNGRRPVQLKRSPKIAIIDEPDCILGNVLDFIEQKKNIKHIFLLGTPCSLKIRKENGILSPESRFLEMFFTKTDSLRFWTRGRDVYDDAFLKASARSLSEKQFEAEMLESYNKYKK